VLWDRDEANAKHILAALSRERGLVVGDNEPYSGRHPANFTIDHHARAAGLPHLCIEVRQDLLESPAGVERWVRLLGRHLRAMLADPATRRMLQEESPAWPRQTRR
jgi:predicted N-formylglutamate amidohydrolase